MIIYKYKKIKEKGFVILFAVTLAAFLLSIALGVTNIAFREVRFSTNAVATNDAFFAADTGAEYVLFNDKNSPYGQGLTDITPISGLGSSKKSCVTMTIEKNASGETTIISKGYSNGGEIPGQCAYNQNAVERQIRITY